MFPMFSPNLWKRTTVIQSILPMGLAWLATPLIFSTWLHRWHLNITLASWTYLRPSSVGLELLSSPQNGTPKWGTNGVPMGYQWGTNGVPMGPGRLLWYVASHLANFPVQPWRPNSSKDNQCSKVPSGNDCYSSLLKMVIEKLIYPWIAWWIFPISTGSRAPDPADGHPLRQRRTPRPSDHKTGKWYGEEMRISLHLVKLTND